MDENKGNTLLQEILPGSVRIAMHTRRRGRGNSYLPVAGYGQSVQVRTLEEAERLWRSVQDVIEGGAWHDGAPRVVPRRRRAPGSDVAVDQEQPVK